MHRKFDSKNNKHARLKLCEKKKRQAEDGAKCSYKSVYTKSFFKDRLMHSNGIQAFYVTRKINKNVLQVHFSSYGFIVS